MPPEKQTKIDRAIHEANLRLRKLEQERMVILAEINQLSDFIAMLEAIKESKQYE
jgi:cell division protein FtsB